MTLVVLALALAFLLALNAFFVLAEFAIIKVRSTRVAELVNQGDRRAKVLQGIQTRLDEFLSVCQVGITLASVALGMVGKKATDEILGGNDELWRYIVAMSVSYVLVSGSHIVLAELVPKSIAIRIADRAALWSARPMMFFSHLFFPALWALNKLANGILRLCGLPPAGHEQRHSEDELRMLLDQSQGHGLMSFRRLLFMENVFDLGELKVKDAMRPRAQVQCLQAGKTWTDNLQLIRARRFTRYPLIDTDPEQPLGLVHLKDLFLLDDGNDPDLRRMLRPFLTVKEDAPLEGLLGEMQRKRTHAALVRNGDGKWTGFLTLEDVIEEIVGTIRDEFEDEEHVHLADVISPDRVHLGMVADGPIAAVRQAMAQMKPEALPLPAEQIALAIEERERMVGTYLGRHLGMPHARHPSITKPFVMIISSQQGIPYPNVTERAHLLFVLLTPAGQPRVHQRLQAVIATMLDESEFVYDRLRTATTAVEVVEILRAGEQAALD